jgi:hypothetical protein
MIFASPCAKDWTLIQKGLICTWVSLVLAQMQRHFIPPGIFTVSRAWGPLAMLPRLHCKIIRHDSCNKFIGGKMLTMAGS